MAIVYNNKDEETVSKYLKKELEDTEKVDEVFSIWKYHWRKS